VLDLAPTRPGRGRTASARRPQEDEAAMHASALSSPYLT
jgi:hypothetical protein